MKTNLAYRFCPARIINTIVLCRKTIVMKSKSKNETLAQIRDVAKRQRVGEVELQKEHRASDALFVVPTGIEPVFKV